MYSDHDLSIKIFTEHKSHDTSVFKSLFVEICLNNENKLTFLEKFDEPLSKLTRNEKICYICGDFNLAYWNLKITQLLHSSSVGEGREPKKGTREDPRESIVWSAKIARKSSGTNCCHEKYTVGVSRILKHGLQVSEQPAMVDEVLLLLFDDDDDDDYHEWWSYYKYDSDKWYCLLSALPTKAKKKTANRR